MLDESCVLGTSFFQIAFAALLMVAARKGQAPRMYFHAQWRRVPAREVV